MTAGRLQALLNGYRLDCTTEAHLQAGIRRVLEQNAVEFEAEVSLSGKDRIDFLVGSVGVECKVGGSLSDLTRQLYRYADSDRVAELLVVTSRLRLAKLPETIKGKGVRVHAILAGIG